jgi:hypothetical protein
LGAKSCPALYRLTDLVHVTNVESFYTVYASPEVEDRNRQSNLEAIRSRRVKYIGRCPLDEKLDYGNKRCRPHYVRKELV